MYFENCVKERHLKSLPAWRCHTLNACLFWIPILKSLSPLLFLCLSKLESFQAVWYLVLKRLYTSWNLCYYIGFMHVIPAQTLSTGSWISIPGAMPHESLTSFLSVRHQSAAVSSNKSTTTLSLFLWLVTTTKDVKPPRWKEFAFLYYRKYSWQHGISKG